MDRAYKDDVVHDLDAFAGLGTPSSRRGGLGVGLGTTTAHFVFTTTSKLDAGFLAFPPRPRFRHIPLAV